jgi:hypothetical protein
MGGAPVEPNYALQLRRCPVPQKKRSLSLTFAKTEAYGG